MTEIKEMADLIVQGCRLRAVVTYLGTPCIAKSANSAGYCWPCAYLSYRQQHLHWKHSIQFCRWQAFIVYGVILSSRHPNGSNIPAIAKKHHGWLA